MVVLVVESLSSIVTGSVTNQIQAFFTLCLKLNRLSSSADP